MTEGVYTLEDHPRSRRRSRRRRGPVSAVVLAGGKGTRLAPYTSVLPKPLMPIGERSILEVVLNQLSRGGIKDVTLCVGYLAHLIEAVLGHRPLDDLSISYVYEKEALGTAGPLRLVDGLDGTFVVMNGDVLSTVDFNDVIEQHHRQGNMLTIATHERPIKIDYGVLHVGANGGRDRVKAYIEKPEMTSLVSMGIYVLEPEALEYVPASGYFDFPNLVQALLAANERVGAYRHRGLWFDIGRPHDYELAVSTWLQEDTQPDVIAATATELI